MTKVDVPDGDARKDRLFTVFGGTGFVGRRVVRCLLEGGHRVRVAARHPDRTSGIPSDPRVERIRADLFEPATLAAALKDTEGAVNATSLYLERGDVTFTSVHVEAAGRLAAIARKAGVRRFVQMSGIGADPSSPDGYIRARGLGEKAVRDALESATILRSAVMFGEGDAFLSAILRTARFSPVFPLFGRGRTRLQPVAADDVARGICALLTGDPPDAPVYEAGGPRVLTYRDLVEEVLRAAGMRRLLVPLPFAAWRAMGAAGEHLPGTPLTRSQIALVERDNVASRSVPGLSELGISPVDVVDHVRETQRR